MTVAWDDIRSRAEPWLAAIPGASPGGTNARFEPEYQSVAVEVAKLEAPAAGEVNWSKVADGAGAVLRQKSKDLVVAAYLAHALHVTKGADGLVTGEVLLAELLERYWDTMFPDAKRLRARANALQWFLERTALALGTRSGAPPAAQDVDALEAAVKKLAEVARARLADMAPAFGTLQEQVARLKLELAPPPPPPEPATAPTPQPGAAAPAPAPAAPTSASPAPASAAPAPGDLASAAEAVDWLRNVGTVLASAADVLRRADGADPTGYRVLRVGLWIHLSAAPPAAGGKTQIAPPPEALRTQLGLLASNQRWAALLEEAESAAARNRFWLDLQRLVWQALAGLGAAHERARDAVAAEVRVLVGRMPTLATLSFSDGTPLADPQTRAWLDEQVAAPAGGAPARAVAAGGEEVAAKAEEAKKLLAGGQVPAALARLRDAVASGRSGRERFLLRLELARLCSGAGLTAVAKATYEELDREASAHALERWEPALAAECLKGLIASARALAKDPRGALPDVAEPYRRLCRLDPAAAHEVWP